MPYRCVSGCLDKSSCLVNTCKASEKSEVREEEVYVSPLQAGEAQSPSQFPEVELRLWTRPGYLDSSRFDGGKIFLSTCGARFCKARSLSPQANAANHLLSYLIPSTLISSCRSGPNALGLMQDWALTVITKQRELPTVKCWNLWYVWKGLP